MKTREQMIAEIEAAQQAPAQKKSRQQMIAELEAADRFSQGDSESHQPSDSTAKVNKQRTPGFLETALNAAVNIPTLGEGPRVAAGLRSALTPIAELVQGDVIDPRTGKPISKEKMFKPTDVNAIADEFQRGREEHPVGSALGSIAMSAALPASFNTAIGQVALGALTNPSGRTDRGLQLGDRLVSGGLSALGSGVGAGTSFALKKASEGLTGLARSATGMSKPVIEAWERNKPGVAALAKKYSQGGEKELAENALNVSANALGIIRNRVEHNAKKLEEKLLGNTVKLDIDQLKALNHPEANKLLSSIEVPGRDILGAPSLVKAIDSSGTVDVDANVANKLRQVFDDEAKLYRRGIHEMSPTVVRGGNNNFIQSVDPTISAKKAEDLYAAANPIRDQINQLPEAGAIQGQSKKMYSTRDWITSRLESPISLFDTSNPDTVAKLAISSEFAPGLDVFGREMAAAKNIAKSPSGFSLKQQVAKPLARGAYDVFKNVVPEKIDKTTIIPYLNAIARERAFKNKEQENENR